MSEPKRQPSEAAGTGTGTGTGPGPGPGPGTDRGSGRRWMLQLGLALVVIAGAAGLREWWIATTPRTQRRPREREATPVRVVTVASGSHPLTIVAHGTVVPAHDVELRPEVRGRVTAVHPGLIPGSVLPAGATLAQIDSRDYEFELQRLESALIEKQSALRLEEGNQEIARREYALLGDLGKRGDASLALREPQLAAAKAAVRAATVAVETARLQIARTQVTVPFDAVVRRKLVAPGAQVTENTILAELAGVDTWWIEVTLPVSDLRWIRRLEASTGAWPTATIRDDAAWEPGRTRTGAVTRVAADLQRDGRLARLFVAVPDPLARTAAHAGEPRLLIDAWVRVELNAGELGGAVALEPAWIRDGASVWVRTPDGSLEVRPVTTAFRDRDRVLVTGGLADGDQVVVSDLAAAVPGMQLRVLEAPPARAAQARD